MICDLAAVEFRELGNSRLCRYGPAQPCTQRAGLGYPHGRVVGLLCLGSNALLDTAMGPYQGKGNSEQSLVRTMLGVLQFGDVRLAMLAILPLPAR